MDERADVATLAASATTAAASEEVVVDHVMNWRSAPKTAEVSSYLSRYNTRDGWPSLSSRSQADRKTEDLEVRRQNSLASLATLSGIIQETRFRQITFGQ
eukprot:scaffold2493_cov78-Skeletonema_dohrnii-CCMP3373.AAC.1